MTLIAIAAKVYNSLLLNHMRPSRKLRITHSFTRFLNKTKYCLHIVWYLSYHIYQPLRSGRIWHKRSLTGLKSEFSFSSTSYLTKAEEPSLPYYLPIAGGRIIGFIPFPRVLELCEMQSVSSRIWTRVAVSISYDDNHYTTCHVPSTWQDLTQGFFNRGDLREGGLDTSQNSYAGWTMLVRRSLDAIWTMLNFFLLSRHIH